MRAGVADADQRLDRVVRRRHDPRLDALPLQAFHQDGQPRVRRGHVLPQQQPHAGQGQELVAVFHLLRLRPPRPGFS